MLWTQQPDFTLRHTEWVWDHQELVFSTLVVIPSPQQCSNLDASGSCSPKSFYGSVALSQLAHKIFGNVQNTSCALVIHTPVGPELVSQVIVFSRIMLSCAWIATTAICHCHDWCNMSSASPMRSLDIFQGTSNPLNSPSFCPISCAQFIQLEFNCLFCPSHGVVEGFYQPPTPVPLFQFRNMTWLVGVWVIILAHHDTDVKDGEG